MTDQWLDACGIDDIDEDDILRFDHEDNTFCIYHTSNGYFATDGYCTHAEEHLEYGIVEGTVIECPLHQGKFDIPTGKALSGPVCIDLKTYALKIENNRIYINLD
ncbi:Rieske family ferredoxin [Chromatiales bacterium (ex Bugula neritina AB1)]|nr:Rieske family ferredoxin [Chromatiales bacterium (ex Bugula neritina AB1)]